MCSDMMNNLCVCALSRLRMKIPTAPSTFPYFDSIVLWAHRSAVGDRVNTVDAPSLSTAPDEIQASAEGLMETSELLMTLSSENTTGCMFNVLRLRLRNSLPQESNHKIRLGALSRIWKRISPHVCVLLRIVRNVCATCDCWINRGRRSLIGDLIPDWNLVRCSNIFITSKLVLTV